HGDHGAYWQYSPVDKMLASGGSEVLPGSYSLFELGTWNQRGDDLRGVDAVAIAGNGDTAHTTDGLVSVNSASISFTGFRDWDQRTRVIPYCHGPILVSSCTGDYLANVKGPDHLSYQIIRSFLDGTDDWKTIGVSASQASKTGGVIAQIGTLIGCLSGNEGDGNVCGHWPTLGTNGVTDSAGVIDSFTGKQLPVGTPLLAGGGGPAAFYWDFNAPGLLTISYNAVVWNSNPPGWVAPRREVDVTIQPGTYQWVFDRTGTTIAPFGIVPANGLTGLAHSLKPGALISIHGQSLGPTTPTSSTSSVVLLGGTSVSVIEASTRIPCIVTYVSADRIDALLPAGLQPGLHTLTVTANAGTDTVPIMIE
ncbi:MAG TPA: hypothetical protein VKD24_00515, partial [Candidatus Angelobacter sp.]|nr:hypothetical protein [Candidatus Angelobacter sp.]